MPLDRRSGIPRRLQRHWIYPSRHRPRTPRRRASRLFLPARNLRPTRHDEHHFQSAGKPRAANPAHCRRSELFAIASFKAKFRMKMPAFSAASPATPASFPPLRISPSFAHAMLNGGAPVLSPETFALFTRRESSPAGTSRALGWDTPSAPSQSGKYFGPGSFGHLGYTGTSLWIDPVRQLSITLLTNRTWPDCSNQAIKQVRPRFHDAVIEALRSDITCSRFG